MRKPLRFTAHAHAVMEERRLERAWVERAVYSPEWQAPDLSDPAIIRRYAIMPDLLTNAA
jgi:hypothetical protein